MSGKRLTQEQAAAVTADIQAGLLDVPSIAEKHGIATVSVYQRRKALGLPSLAKGKKPASRAHLNAPSRGIDMAALHADIASGMNEDDIREKYKIGHRSFMQLRREHRTGKSTPQSATGEPTAMTSATALKIVAMLGKLAVKFPAIFEELDILPRLLKRHANIITEIL